MFHLHTGRVVGGLWVRLGKIKCGAKALALRVGLHLFLFYEALIFLSFFVGLSMFVECLLVLGITFCVWAPGEGTREIVTPKIETL